MKERPILFSAPMVRAILDGSKTQTRRVAPVLLPGISKDYIFAGSTEEWQIKRALQCRYGQPGDRLWVRETWQAWHKTGHEYDEWEPISVKAATASKRIDFECGPTCDAIEYKATSESTGPWTPSIHMPRWASRINLEITGVRVERLQEISEAGALSEGIERSTWEYSCEPYRNYRKPAMAPGENCSSPRTSFMTLWESINGPGSWDLNPWVWVIEFKKI
jgi:hypothetical protein